jgi:hypothetical protein
MEVDKKTIFHLLDLTIFNSYILISSCCKKTSHREFHLCWDMLILVERELRQQETSGRPANVSTRVSRYAAVCAWHAELSVKLVSSTKSQRWVFVQIKTVFWTMPWSHTCNRRRNVDFPLGGENSWPNLSMNFKKFITVQAAVHISQFKKKSYVYEILKSQWSRLLN